MFNFFSKKSTYAPSDYFLASSTKDKYFYRLMPFSKLNDGAVVAYDPNAPRIITFDPWPQQIFLNATGLVTVHEFLNTMAGLYNGRVPELLDRTIIDETERMVKCNYIAFSDEQVTLDDKFMFPIKPAK